MTENNNFEAQKETFDAVMTMIKWGSVATAIIVAIVIFMIAS